MVLAGTKYALGIKEARDWKNCHEEKRQKIGLRWVDNMVAFEMDTWDECRTAVESGALSPTP